MDLEWDDETTQPGVGSKPLDPVDFDLADYPRFVLVVPVGVCYLCARKNTNLTYQIGVGNFVFCCPNCALGPPMDLNEDFRRSLEGMLQRNSTMIR